mmetsp:Transcript_37391/g.93934  ORF Transcript_37391/g.93934 Transcript_37391/m.93934 type:complete len:208 (+) Transcript_37391:867-1490(+)
MSENRREALSNVLHCDILMVGHGLLHDGLLLCRFQIGFERHPVETIAVELMNAFKEAVQLYSVTGHFVEGVQKPIHVACHLQQEEFIHASPLVGQTKDHTHSAEATVRVKFGECSQEPDLVKGNQITGVKVGDEGLIVESMLDWRDRRSGLWHLAPVESQMQTTLGFVSLLTGTVLEIVPPIDQQFLFKTVWLSHHNLSDEIFANQI